MQGKLDSPEMEWFGEWWATWHEALRTGNGKAQAFNALMHIIDPALVPTPPEPPEARWIWQFQAMAPEKQIVFNTAIENLEEVLGYLESIKDDIRQSTGGWITLTSVQQGQRHTKGLRAFIELARAVISLKNAIEGFRPITTKPASPEGESDAAA